MTAMDSEATCIAQNGLLYDQDKFDMVWRKKR